jgi:hypothetical protein
MDTLANKDGLRSKAIGTPGINVLRRSGGYRVNQTRPPVGLILAKLPLELALDQIANVLPICGEAQRIAARRAVEAAQGQITSAGPGDSETLFREQLQSSLWRLAMDWPSLIGESQDLGALRLARRTNDPGSLQEQLQDQLDGLEKVESPGAARAWIERGKCTAARVTSRALDLEAQSPDWAEPVTLLPGSVIESGMHPEFWPEGDSPLVPPAGEVGALAMRRHPLVGDRDLPRGLLARRLLAQALDAAFLATAEPESAVPSDGSTCGAHAGSIRGTAGEGIGWAMTARGPLMHRVKLEGVDGETLGRWDVLAPTDWHFGPQGPAVQALGALNGSIEPEVVRFFMAGFDPCAAWSVVDAEGTG